MSATRILGVDCGSVDVGYDKGSGVTTVAKLARIAIGPNFGHIEGELPFDIENVQAAILTFEWTTGADAMRVVDVAIVEKPSDACDVCGRSRRMCGCAWDEGA